MIGDFIKRWEWLLWILLIAVAALGARLGYEAIQESGRAEVRAEWQQEKDRQAAAAKEQQAERERAARAEDSSRATEAERIANEQAEREEADKARAAATAARERSLLNTIAALNQRAAELSSGAEDPRVAAFAREATTARGLLGECTARYRAVADDANQLRGQVIGLLDFDRNAVRDAAAIGAAE
ncbi:MAG: hypothetical protein ABS43_03700 [Bordetella sp. SCN 67-23]|nr:DUF2514 family protein [Burkholderiales bacterium]ODS75906.1 MAG: hypothetical protein ABS43_03700 [Bordetella sp. SCN 67-23]OJW91782.1 MAG: hypothetical protein BGO71_21730 [Burkholderiales bacterium 67-32]